MRRLFLILSVWYFPANAVHALEIQVAVASNFSNCAKEIAAAFETTTGNRVVLVSGSTGKLYAQATGGAPYDVLLAADVASAKLLEKSGVGVPGTRFTYAVGRLVLWSSDPNLIGADAKRILELAGFRHLAIANPKTAPYGKAAVQAMKNLGVLGKIEPLLVQGENIGQAFQFVASGNAELGFVSLSQINDPNNKIKGSGWEVPANLHDPVDQDAILLRRGGTNAAARAFLDFMRGDAARKIIALYGYGLK